MARSSNTNSRGGAFTQDEINAVWCKGKIIANTNSDYRRLDIWGAIIEKDKYGDTTENGCGWEIDHIKPVAKGGTDDLSNLQPLQWQNNRKKCDNYPASNADYAVSAAKN